MGGVGELAPVHWQPALLVSKTIVVFEKGFSSPSSGKIQKTLLVQKPGFPKLAHHKSPLFKHIFPDSPRESAFLSGSSHQTIWATPPCSGS